jgi:two-component system, NarL family, nitrate/nitrite response regulator NarL
LIRVAIYADTVVRARRLAAMLAEDERLEIADVRATSRGGPQASLVDVVLAAGLRFEQLWADGPAIVLVSAEPPRSSAFGKAVRAWLPDDALPQEISAALVAAAQDLSVLTRGQIRRWLRSAAEDELAPAQEALTPRELEVLHMMADGLSNKQIAAELAISDHTAKFHVAQILAKLGAGSRTEAVTIAIRRGLAPI